MCLNLFCCRISFPLIISSLVPATVVTGRKMSSFRYLHKFSSLLFYTLACIKQIHIVLRAIGDQPQFHSPLGTGAPMHFTVSSAPIAVHDIGYRARTEYLLQFLLCTAIWCPFPEVHPTTKGLVFTVIFSYAAIDTPAL